MTSTSEKFFHTQGFSKSHSTISEQQAILVINGFEKLLDGFQKFHINFQENSPENPQVIFQNCQVLKGHVDAVSLRVSSWRTLEHFKNPSSVEITHKNVHVKSQMVMSVFGRS